MIFDVSKTIGLFEMSVKGHLKTQRHIQDDIISYNFSVQTNPLRLVFDWQWGVSRRGTEVGK